MGIQTCLYFACLLLLRLTPVIPANDSDVVPHNNVALDQDNLTHEAATNNLERVDESFGCFTDEPALDNLRKEYEAMKLPPIRRGQYGEQSSGHSLLGGSDRYQWFLCRYFLHTPLCRFPSVTIDVYVHDIVKEAGTKEDGGAALDNSDIDLMLVHANNVFKKTGFNFVLKGKTQNVNNTWFAAVRGSNEEYEMKANLRVGGLETLNVYMKAVINQDGSLGCGFSIYANSAQEMFIRDGVVVSKLCLGPGDGLKNGDTFPHEIGHFLNLYHTFDGGCDPGDLVADTPAQASYTKATEAACPDPFPDTCPLKRGRDPIDNIMGYGADACRQGFTKGQTARMHRGWLEFRAP